MAKPTGEFLRRRDEWRKHPCSPLSGATPSPASATTSSVPLLTQNHPHRSGCDCDIKMKKTKSKKPKAEHESHVVEKEKKASFKPKKMGSEIDEIFAAKKRKRLENEKKGEDEKAGKVVAANVRPLDKRKRMSSKTRSFEQNSFADRISQQKKKTADGLTIFTEEELGIGKPDAGGTALCPFDCDCCF